MKPPVDTRVSVGDSASLSCAAEGTPTPSVEWYIDGIPFKGRGCKAVITWKSNIAVYCWIILICKDQCKGLIDKNFLVRGDVIWWVTRLLHYNVRQFITLLNLHGDVNLWVRVHSKVCCVNPLFKKENVDKRKWYTGTMILLNDFQPYRNSWQALHSKWCAICEKPDKKGVHGGSVQCHQHAWLTL